MWYYTKKIDDTTSDVELYIANLMNQANTAYLNSNINLKLRTMCIERLPDSYVESRVSSSDMLQTLQRVKGSSAALRQTADIVLMVTASSPDSCGAVSNLLRKFELFSEYPRISGLQKCSSRVATSRICCKRLPTYSHSSRGRAHDGLLPQSGAKLQKSEVSLCVWIFDPQHKQEDNYGVSRFNLISRFTCDV